MKVAISLPDPLFDAAEQLARQRGISRSQLYAEALADYLATRGASAVRDKLDAVYAVQTAEVPADLDQAQRRTLIDEAW